MAGIARPRPARLAARVKGPRVPEHAFELDEQVPPDFHGGRHCKACGKGGDEGDRQHPLGALPLALAIRPPLPPGVREFEDRKLGEQP